MSAIFGFLIGILQFIGKVLFEYWGWVLVVAILSYLIWRNRRETQWLEQTEFEILQITLPAKTAGSAAAAEQLISALHGIYRSTQDVLRGGGVQEYISFELSGHDGEVGFYIWLPKHLHELVEKHFEAQYPDAKLSVVSDYLSGVTAATQSAGWELKLNNDFILPIRTYQTLENDSMSAFCSILSGMNKHERLSLQILVRPTDDAWHRRADSAIRTIKTRGTMQRWSGRYFDAPRFALQNLLQALWRSPEQQLDSNISPTDSAQEEQIGLVKNKIAKPGFRVRIRALHTGKQAEADDVSLRALFGAFKQFSDNNNSLRIKRPLEGKESIGYFRARYFNERGDILNAEELASIYHLPEEPDKVMQPAKSSAKSDESEINSADLAKQSNHQAALPKIINKMPGTSAAEVSLIGSVDYKGKPKPFGILRADRQQHTFVIGQAGTGKSSLVKLLALSDLHHGAGVAVIDPYGQSVRELLRYIPQKRLNQVVYLRPRRSAQLGIGFNPLSGIAPAARADATNKLVNSCEQLFPKGWNTHIEYILRYAILALLEYNQAWFGNIIDMLENENFRLQVLGYISDPVVQNFWQQEWPRWQSRYDVLALTPLKTRLGEFIHNPSVASILHNEHQINFESLLKNRQILLANLDAKQLGISHAGALGSLLLQKLQQAATGEQPAFYLYLDDFQHYVGDMLAELLAEERTRKLNVVLSTQTLGLVGAEMRQAVFSGVGTLVSFRLNQEDAHYISNYLAPIEPQALMNLHLRHFAISMNVEGVKVAPFISASLTLPPPRHDYSARLIA